MKVRGMERNRWTLAGVIVSLLYVAAISAVSYQNETGLARKFGELSLNELGDMLSGGFAPLAFLWLFIATMIQSQELAAQRKEIEENRAVMQEQSNAAQDQAAFLKAQTDAMERQTQLLIEQVNIAQQSAERTHKMALFEKRIEIYNEVVAFARLGLKRRQFKESHVTTLQVLATRAEFVFGEDVIDWLDKLYQQVDYIVVQTRAWELSSESRMYGTPRAGVESETSKQIDDQIETLKDMLWGGQLKQVMGKYLDLNEYRTVQMDVTEGPDTITS